MSDYKSNNITDISSYLPHQKPMLMVDFIDEISENEVITKFTISSDNIFVVDGFFQECGLIENAAQTCSSIVGQNYFFDENLNKNQNVEVIGFISAIKKIEIFQLPQINTQIITKAQLESRFEGDDYSICSMFIEIKNNENVLLKGTMNLFLQKM